MARKPEIVVRHVTGHVTDYGAPGMGKSRMAVDLPAFLLGTFRTLSLGSDKRVVELAFSSADPLQ